MNEILPLGSCLPVDGEGYLLFKPDPMHIQPHWSALLQETTKIYLEHYGKNLHSVYVRGTVAKGSAIDGISDLDTIALVYEGSDEIQPAWSGEPRRALLKKYPFATGIEFVVAPMQSLDKE